VFANSKALRDLTNAIIVYAIPPYRFQFKIPGLIPKNQTIVTGSKAKLCLMQLGIATLPKIKRWCCSSSAEDAEQFVRQSIKQLQKQLPT
jgi:hypothetical protein